MIVSRNPDIGIHMTKLKIYVGLFRKMGIFLLDIWQNRGFSLIFLRGPAYQVCLMKTTSGTSWKCCSPVTITWCPSLAVARMIASAIPPWISR